MTESSPAAPETARSAAERTAQAVVAGNLAQLMADITPEALGQLMQLGAQAQGSGSGLSLTNMPNMTGYEIKQAPAVADGEVFHLTFDSSAGSATIATTWKQVFGQWKITAIALVAATPTATPLGAVEPSE